MRFSSIGPGEAAVIAAGFAFASHIVPWLGKALGKRRLEARRLTIESVRHDQDRLNGSYRRLESENERIWSENTRLRERITSLETAVGLAESRCDEMERILRRLGKMPNENGDPT